MVSYQNHRAFLVRVTGVEPARLSAREPKSRMSANSIIPAVMSGGARRPLFHPLFLHGEGPEAGRKAESAYPPNFYTAGWSRGGARSLIRTAARVNPFMPAAKCRDS